MSNNEISKKSKIVFDIALDKDNLPLTINWEAEDADEQGKQEAKALLLSLWDGLQQNALRIDLWTTEMKVDEMNLFMFQTLATLGDTYERATNNKELADEIREFAHHFGHRAKLFYLKHSRAHVTQPHPSISY